MKLSIALLVLTFVFVSQSAARADGFRNPMLPPCALGVSYDSFRRGIEDGFKGTSTRPKLVDEACYQWGLNSGRETRAAELSSSFCEQDFDSGYRDGHARSTRSLTSDCNSQGYEAGEAALDIEAREGRAQPDCQDAYDNGKRDARNASYQLPIEAVALHCYQLGSFEGVHPEFASSSVADGAQDPKRTTAPELRPQLTRLQAASSGSTRTSD